MGGLRVALDTNVLIAAMLSPRGASRRLLGLAALELFQPIITSEVLAEMAHHCRRGLNGRSISDEEIAAFRVAIAPLLDWENLASSPVGRAESQYAPLVNVDNQAILLPHPELMGHPRGEQKRTEGISDTHAFIKDMGDAHVLAAAIRHKCDFICSGNTKDFPADFEMGSLRCVTPGRLLALLLEEDDEDEPAR